MKKINLGTLGLNGSGDSGPAGGGKINDNFIELASKILGNDIWTNNTDQSLALSALDTTDKANLINAINEVLTNLNSLIADTTASSETKTYSIDKINEKIEFLRGESLLEDSNQTVTGFKTFQQTYTQLESASSDDYLDKFGVITEFRNTVNQGNTFASIRFVLHQTPCDGFIGLQRMGDNAGADFFIVLSESDDNVDPDNVVRNTERFRITEGGKVLFSNYYSAGKLEINSDAEIVSVPKTSVQEITGSTSSATILTTCNVVKVDSSNTCALTLPASSNYTYDVIEIYNVSATSQISLTAASNVTISSARNIALNSNDISCIQLRKIADNSWLANVTIN